MVSTANKYKLRVGGLSLYNKPFQVGQVRNFSKKKKKFWPAQFLTYTTSYFCPLSSDFLSTASSQLSVFQVLLSGKSKEPQVLVVLMSLLSISCQLLYSYAIEFLPPIPGWNWVFYPPYYCLLISLSLSKFVSPFFFCLSRRYHYSSCLKEKAILHISLL